MNELPAKLTHIPTNLNARLDLVVAVCISEGGLSRENLANFYQISHYEASVLLRDFLHYRGNDIHWDAATKVYSLKRPRPQV